MYSPLIGEKLFSKRDLSPLNSTLITTQKENSKGRSARKIFTGIRYLVYFVTAGFFLWAFIGYLRILLLVLVVGIPMAIFVGWRYMSYYQLFVATPTAKVESAANGLNEVEVKFQPEKNNFLKTPINGVPCVYYKVDIHKVVRSGKSRKDIVLASFEKGVPSLLTDGTGYLLANFNSAEINFKARFYNIQDVQKSSDIFEFITDAFTDDESRILKEFIQNAKNSNTEPDFSELYSKFGFIPAGDARDVWDNDVYFALGRNLYLAEIYIPTDQTFYVLGRVSDSGKRYNDKPLKDIYIDPNSKVFSIMPESEQQATQSLRNYAFISFAAAIIFLIVSVLIYNSGIP